MAFIDLFKKAKKSSKKAKPLKKAEKPGKLRQEKKPAYHELELDRDVWPIKIVAIVEMVGSPKEYIVDTMNLYVEKMKNEKDIKISNVTISDAAQIEVDTTRFNKKEKPFSIFAEIEIFAKKPSRIVDYCLDYMPSSIEIIEPESLKFSAHDFSNFFNDLQARLHQLDSAVKVLRMENDLMRKNANTQNENIEFYLRNSVLILLKEKDKNLATISKNFGLPENIMKTRLDKWAKQGYILINGDKYSLNKEKVSFSE